MSRRPLPVTLISWLFMAAGAIGLAYHARELDVWRPFENDAVWVCSLRLLAIVCGAFMLRGANWARWLLVAWFAYHVVLSALHTPFELVVHGALFAAITYLLFRPEASAFFGRSPLGKREEDRRLAALRNLDVELPREDGRR